MTGTLKGLNTFRALRFAAALAAFSFLLFLTPFTSHASSSLPALKYSQGDDYPYKDMTYGRYSSEDIDPWRFYYRECTSFVAWCLNSRNKIEFTNFYGGTQWSNANNWGYAAMSLGITVDNTPAVGAVYWTTEGGYGHVGWVSEIRQDGGVVVEEYNALVRGGYSVRVVGENLSVPDGYIHIQDLPQSDTPGQPDLPSGNYRKKWVNYNGYWYYFDSKGNLKSGWLKLKNKKYYLDPETFRRCTGWVKVNGKKYHMNSKGVMQTGWTKIKNKWYYFKNNGVMKTGWLKIGKKWYYLRKNGQRATNEDITINGKMYSFRKNGTCRNHD